MAGRPPKPIEQHIADGTWRQDRHPLPVVLGERALPDAPSHLEPAAAELWDLLVVLLEPILDTADFGAVEGACIMLTRARQASQAIQREGIVLTLETDKGPKVIENPALKIERQSYQAFVVFADRLGLSPVARARLGLQLVRGRNALEQLEDTIGRSPLDTPPDEPVEAEPIIEDDDRLPATD